jgi:endonuclease/exonuclease/phosphatase family metal-dependent hydrolase
MNLKVLSYNIHKGFSTLPFDFVLEEIKKSIQLVNADIVFLQEVVGENVKKSQKIKNWPEESQFEFLADTVWKHYAYGKNAVYSSGHHGNAILSKYPIESFENFNISKTPLEKRGILYSKIKLPGLNKNLHLFCLHFGLFEKGRILQAKDLCELILKKDIDEPTIVAGDFNDWKHTIADILEKKVNLQDAYMMKHGKAAKTFPSLYPILKLDRIYFKHLEMKDCHVMNGRLWKELSDHCPLYAVFKID